MRINSEEKSLLAQVLIDPESDEPRLRYAEWLDGHGQKPRAELIKVQCSLDHLRIREKELLEKHAFNWIGELRNEFGIKHAWFHRGFPSDIAVSVDKYLRYGDELRELTPITYLRINGVNDASLSQFVTLPSNRSLRGLDINRWDGGVVSELGMKALAASPYLTHLEELSVYSNELGENGIRTLLRSTFIKNLKKLSVHDTNLKHNKEIFSQVLQSVNHARFEEINWMGTRHEFHFVKQHGHRDLSNSQSGPVR